MAARKGARVGMTCEEAKAKFLLEYCPKCGEPLPEECAACEINIAIEALEKQIPKKPVSVTISGISRYKSGACECGTAIAMVYKYCPNCGQAIDWEEK